MTKYNYKIQLQSTVRSFIRLFTYSLSPSPTNRAPRLSGAALEFVSHVKADRSLESALSGVLAVVVASVSLLV